MVKVALPKTGQKPLRHARMPLKHLWARSPCQRPVSIRPLPRWDATEVPVGRVVVPKTVQKPPSPRRDAPEVTVGMVAVPKTVQKPPSPRDNLYPMCASRFPCARDHTPL